MFLEVYMQHFNVGPLLLGLHAWFLGTHADIDSKTPGLNALLFWLGHAQHNL